MNASSRPFVRACVASAAALVLLAAMVLDTRIVRIGSASDSEPNQFSAARYGRSEFPKVRSLIESRAVDATVLAAAIAKDQDAAAKRYGVQGGVGPEFCVKFTGIVGSGEYGVFDVKIDGMPANFEVRVQTGPAINGTDLRDATGTISFGQFVNQIDYQNAGSALNNEMKKQVLARIDNTHLTGKTVSVVGAFQLINPASWLVAPVELDVR